MLTPDQIADGWIAHDGGPCPVPFDDRVSVMCRDGVILHDDEEGDCAGNWYWHHDGGNGDIIAYHPETTNDRQ